MNKLSLLGVAILLAGGLCAFGAQSDQVASRGGGAAPTAGADVSGASEKETGGPQLQRRNPRYKLSTGDVFDLNFPLSPEFNQTGITVQPDGYIALLNAGDIHVEGQTIPEVKETIGKAYAKVLHEPEVNIVLRDFQKPYFIATGQVGKPGKYDLRGDTTVMQAVAEAGGFTEKSKHSQVLLFRQVSDDWVEVKKLDMKKMLATKNLQEDIHLRPGDMIYVPQNAYSKIESYIPRGNLAYYLWH
jgi:polysaccharide export outer membrane protein